MSKPEAEYDPQMHDGGLYQRNQDYTADKYAIYKTERQNSVDKVITLDGPLAGTPTTAGLV
jgi:hypothetical protein